MASQVGMTIRTSQANERIDAAMEALTAGRSVPPRPDRVRDPMLGNVLRLEWIADALEAVASAPKAERTRTTAKRDG